MNIERLDMLLSTGRWMEADLETRRLLAGDQFQQGCPHGVIHFLKNNLTLAREIDSKWLTYSYGRFGFSVQSKIYKTILKRPYSLGSFDVSLAQDLVCKRHNSSNSSELEGALTLLRGNAKIMQNLDQLFSNKQFDEVRLILLYLLQGKANSGYQPEFGRMITLDASGRATDERLFEAIVAAKAQQKIAEALITKEIAEIYMDVKSELTKRDRSLLKEFLYLLGWLPKKEALLKPSRLLSGWLRSISLDETAKLIDSSFEKIHLKLYSNYSSSLIDHSLLTFQLTALEGHLPSAYPYYLLANESKDANLAIDLPLTLELFYWLLDLDFSTSA